MEFNYGEYKRNMEIIFLYQIFNIISILKFEVYHLFLDLMDVFQYFLV